MAEKAPLIIHAYNICYKRGWLFEANDSFYGLDFPVSWRVGRHDTVYFVGNSYGGNGDSDGRALQAITLNFSVSLC